MTVDPYGGFRMPAVEKRYLRYLQDNYGDVTDLPRLCEVMWLAGAQEAIQASVEFSDIMPQLARVQQSVRRMHDMFEILQRRGEDAEPSVRPDWREPVVSKGVPK